MLQLELQQSHRGRNVKTADIRAFPHPTGIIIAPRGPNEPARWTWKKVCRCAGTAIWRHALRNERKICAGRTYQPGAFSRCLDNLQALEAAGYENVLGTVWTFVRHPVSRFLSALSYFHYHPDAFAATPAHFLDSWEFSIHTLPQQHYAEGCHFVGRFENLTHDFSRLCEELQIARKPLPQVNRSMAIEWSSLSRDTKRAIIRHVLPEAEALAALGLEYDL